MTQYCFVIVVALMVKRRRKMTIDQSQAPR
jgi:hypothetical protein